MSIALLLIRLLLLGIMALFSLTLHHELMFNPTKCFNVNILYVKFMDSTRQFSARESISSSVKHIVLKIGSKSRMKLLSKINSFKCKSQNLVRISVTD